MKGFNVELVGLAFGIIVLLLLFSVRVYLKKNKPKVIFNNQAPTKRKSNLVNVSLSLGRVKDIEEKHFCSLFDHLKWFSSKEDNSKEVQEISEMLYRTGIRYGKA